MDNRTIDLGIGVLAYDRPTITMNTLISLYMQKAKNVLVLVDHAEGVHPKCEHNNNLCRIMAEGIVRSAPKELNWQVSSGTAFGLEAANIHLLLLLAHKHKAFLYLEDDCFPCSYAMPYFRESLWEIKDSDDILTTYGHHFGIQAEKDHVPHHRFQGWGWAAWSDKVKPYLYKVNEWLKIPKAEYHQRIKETLTEEQKKKLRTTPPRDCVNTMMVHQAWDATLSYHFIQDNIKHISTPRRVIFNCGADGAHFKHIMTQPCFNMVDPAKIWDYF